MTGVHKSKKAVSGKRSIKIKADANGIYMVNTQMRTKKPAIMPVKIL